MIYHIKGDLLKSDCTIIAHSCNCFKTMGAGIAKQIKEQMYSAVAPYFNDDRTPDEKLGTFVSGTYEDKVVFHLYGQLKYGSKVRHTNYDALKSAMEGMFFMANYYIKNNLLDVKLGLPYLIGCGLAGGDWDVVKIIIEDLSEKYNVDVYLYEFTPEIEAFVSVRP